MESKVYNTDGKEIGAVRLPEEVFGVPWSADLVHQVVTSLQLSKRRSTAHTKGRGEVRGGGRKPWRQKGTGRARHGSIRSPLWVGGGVTHGPTKEKIFSRRVNKKMKAKALGAILSRKLRDHEILFLERLSFKAPKTKQALETLKKLGKIPGFEGLANKRRNCAYIALPERNSAVERSFRNMGNLKVSETRNMSSLDLLTYRYLLIVSPEESISELTKRQKV